MPKTSFAEKFERHAVVVGVGLFGAGVLTTLTIFLGIREYVDMRSISAARLETYENVEKQLGELKVEHAGSEKKLRDIEANVQQLQEEKQELSAKLESERAVSAENLGSDADLKTAQCANEVNASLQKAARSSKAESQKAARDFNEMIATLEASLSNANSARDAALRQANACLYKKDAGTSYSKYSEFGLTVFFSDARAKDAQAIAKAIGKYFKRVDITECTSCAKGGIKYPPSHAIDSATDLATVLVSLGFVEFENPKIETIDGNFWFIVSLR